MRMYKCKNQDVWINKNRINKWINEDEQMDIFGWINEWTNKDKDDKMNKLKDL